MRGLIYKDIVNLKKQLVICALLIAFLAIYGIASEDVLVFTVISAVFLLSPMLITSSIAYDDRDGWNTIAAAMPVARDKIVMSKYVLVLIMTAASSVIALFTGFIAGFDIAELMMIILMLASVCIIISDMGIAFLLMFGSEHGRLAFFVFVLVIYCLFISFLDTEFVSGIVAVGVESTGISVMGQITALLAAAAIAVTAVAVTVTRRVYATKDF